MYKKILERKTVIISDETKEILDIFDDVIKQLKSIASDPTDHQLSATDTKLRNEGLFVHVTNRLGQAFNTNLGANERVLPAKAEYLDPIAHALMLEYETFLTNLLLDYKKNDAYKLTESEKISNKSTLLREILIVLALEALNVHNEGVRDGQLVVKAIDDFMERLQKSSVFRDKIYTKFFEQLYRDNGPWLKLFYEIIDTIKLLNLHKDTLISAMGYISKLRKAILSQVISEMVVLTRKDLDYQEQLADTYLEHTFTKYFTEMSKQIAFKTTAAEIVTVTSSALELTLSQSDLLGRVKAQYPDSNIELQLKNLVKLNTLGLMLEKVSSFVATVGWFPFLSGIINLDLFSKTFAKHADDCTRAIDAASDTEKLKKYDNMRTALLRYARLPNLDLRLSPIALSHSLKTLSNPTLLKRVAGHIRADIQDLLELQKNTGCTIINTDALQSFGFMNAAPSQDQYHLDLGRFMHASTLCDNGHYQEALLLFEQIKTFTNDKLTTNKVLCYLGLNEKEKARDLFKAIEQPTQELRKLFSVSKPLPAHPLPSHTRGRIDYSPEGTSPDIVGSSHSYQMQQFGAFSPAATGRPQPSSSSSQEASQKPELKRQDSLSKLTNTIKGVVMIKSNKPHHYSLVFVTEFPRDYHKNSKIIYLMQDSASGNWHYSKYSKKYKKAIMGEIFGDSLPQKRPDHSTPEENLGWIVTILNHMESGMGVTNKI